MQLAQYGCCRVLESVGDVHLSWVAEYLVKQASIESNLHSLYLDFLDSLVNFAANL